MSRCSR